MKYPIYSFVGTVKELNRTLSLQYSQVPNLLSYLWRMADEMDNTKKSTEEVSVCCYWPINDFKRCTKCGEAQ